MAIRWSTCWKCVSDIYGSANCHTIRVRDKKYNFCLSCFQEYLEATKGFIQPDRSKREELKKSLDVALRDYHFRIIVEDGQLNKTDILIHDGEDWRDCSVCRDIISMRCSEHCGNTVREVQ